MKLGIVGLGRMGAGIAERLRRDGHEVVGYDQNQAVSQVPSLEALVEALSPPRVLWLMVPAGPPTQGGHNSSVARTTGRRRTPPARTPGRFFAGTSRWPSAGRHCG